MFAGLPDRSADDAWFLTSIDLEAAIEHNQCLVGGALDLYKCFDQLIRLIVYLVLMLAGIPRCVLTAYINYHETGFLLYAVHGHVGTPHRHRCGIPQGCPLSMLFIVFLLRPWIMQMIELGCTPKCLADDMLLTSTGTSALLVFAHAFQATILAHAASRSQDSSSEE